MLAETLGLIERCPCQSGCPSCVGPVGEIGRHGKAAALAILEGIPGREEAAPVTSAASVP